MKDEKRSERDKKQSFFAFFAQKIRQKILTFCRILVHYTNISSQAKRTKETITSQAKRTKVFSF